MTGKTITFETQMKRTGANTTGVVVPPESVEALGGGGRPAVVAEINGYTYRTTIGVMKGLSMLPFSAHHREASGIAGGDPVTVALRLDTDSRSTEVPEDLAQALALEPTVEAAFRKLAPSRRKADVENVAGAKTPETRSRRIEAILTRLR